MTSTTIINRPLEYSLRLFGAWPDSSYSFLKSIIWSTIMATFLMFQYWYCITHIRSGLIDLLDGLSITLSNSLVFLKLIIIWLHSRTFYGILTTVFEDCNNYASTVENKRIMTDKAMLSSRISNFLIGYFSITFLVYSGLALVLFDEDQNGPVSKQRKFLIRMEFPFEATVSPRYEIILVVQFIFEAFIVYGAATSIALIAVLILHVGGQIDLLCQNMRDISRNHEKKVPQKLTIKDVVVRHQRIIRLSKNIETVFTYISLCQFLSNMLVICFISFVLVTSLNTEQTTGLILKCFPYYVAVNCEAFILCYTGEYLTSKSERITQSVYNFLWYDLKPREARIVLLIILRSQKELILTAGKFVNLSLAAFANMLKASASYVSVLHAMC
ncbi:Putative odorant receptor 13a [Habropoda laboriosa]|uniref:Odorant receptor n=1 Tax=Habropoda laboriosa TaxID=597456 RepID=A0A0L7QW76_9HYME|nr:PREDICTED: odorant receptor 4-like [Habropoda laboriosa]KOC62873.1 Putative odorant receptor 13a [Habropoda laboriosa]